MMELLLNLLAILIIAGTAYATLYLIDVLSKDK